MKILIVEDELIQAHYFKDILERFGYEVSGIASNMRDAIEMVLKTCPDLAIIDIVLKEGPAGIETAIELSSRFYIPIIYLTAHTEVEIMKRARATNPIGYLIKPVSEHNLQKAIKDALQKCKVGQQKKVANH